ncbi:hypothetical protein T03_2070 [Trichinella britovi]|uniref:Uncharacterized protein n=1 Tax=Trichinella britovi TaxID=45882 RepID=A0A0V1B7K7_TRIBR|nr:hypothetical protein T03_2070 [Trichinella britovi]
MSIPIKITVHSVLELIEFYIYIERYEATGLRKAIQGDSYLA